MTFKPVYFVLFLAIFIVEIGIALYIHDGFVRPFLGDLLVVILIYALVRAFVKVTVNIAAFGTLAFSFAVEFLQYLQLVDRLGLSENRLARTVIGTSFAWEDLVMYSLGILVVLLTERIVANQARVKDSDIV